jgi:hypothetical protein
LAKRRNQKSTARKKKSLGSQAMSETEYMRRLLVLLEAWFMSETEQDVFWDAGPGERLNRSAQAFSEIARKENLALVITVYPKRNSLLFQFKERPTCWVRVLRDGRILMDSKS